MRDSSSPIEEVPETSSLLTHRGKLLIALALIIGALGYFGFIAFEGATVYYLTVGELNQRGPTTDEELVRVSGKLIPESYKRDEVTGLAHFALTDGEERLVAVSSGVLPDLFFNEHSDIILEGIYGSSEVFDTHNVIVKCPSKYVAESEES